jgi:dihydrofolate reductase
VLTRSPESVAAPARAVSSVDEALRLAAAGGATDLVVAGGAAVYALALPHATRLILTRVHTRTKAERFFPVVDRSRWRRVRSRFHPADPRHEFAFTVSTFERFAS